MEASSLLSEQQRTDDLGAVMSYINHEYKGVFIHVPKTNTAP